jgi:preprotein translocase subunit SecG
METVILVIHVLIAISLVSLILMQQGKGAEMGAAFGSGASSTVFGSQGSASFMTRGTAALATAFFLTSLTLAYFSIQARSVEKGSGSVLERVDTGAPVVQDMPSIPMGAPASSDVPAPN